MQVGYLSQHGEELHFPGARTVIEACIKATGLKPNEARSLLGKFLFSGEDAEKELEGLSGGEHKRLGLAVLVASGANVLILDEPTNHLDIESREALEDALKDYPGSMIMISHDRALLEAIGSRTVAVEDGELRSFLGGWQEYVEEREERKAAERAAKEAGKAAGRAAAANGGAAKAPAAPAAKAAPAGGGTATKTKPAPAMSKNRMREIEKAEAKVERAEEELAALEEELAGADAWATPESTERNTARHEAAKAKVAQLYERLEQLAG